MIMSSKFIRHCIFVLQLKTLIAHTPIVFISIYRITLILSLYINWYLYSTINKLYLLVYPGNQMKYLKVYNLQTYNLLIYTNATGSCFCFYLTNVKNFDNAEGAKSKSETKQTSMSTNTNKNNRNSDNRSYIKQTRVKRVQK